VWGLLERVVAPLMAPRDLLWMVERKEAVSWSEGSEILARMWTVQICNFEQSVAQEMALGSIAVEVEEALMCQMKHRLTLLALSRKAGLVN